MRHSAKSKNISAVHWPSPFIFINCLVISLSVIPANLSIVTSPFKTASAKPLRYITFCGIIPQLHKLLSAAEAIASGVMGVPTVSSRRLTIARLTSGGSCWEMIPVTSVPKYFSGASGCKLQGPYFSINGISSGAFSRR